MNSTIFCNPIDPHSDRIDQNCVVIFQNSNCPNIIVRPTKYGILKPYFVSPIKDLDYRTALYFIPKTDSLPAFYLYEYYNPVINKIIHTSTDSGCSSPESFSDNGSCKSDDELQYENNTSVETNDISIQCNLNYDIDNIILKNNRNKYILQKYFNIWKTNFLKIKFFRIWYQNTKFKIKQKKELRKKLKKQRIKIINYNKQIKSKYFNIWYNNVKKNKKQKIKHYNTIQTLVINQWSKITNYNKLLKSKYFNIWKIKSKNIKTNKKVVILNWKNFIKQNKYLRKHYFKIWKNNVINKKTINTINNNTINNTLFNENIVHILTFLNFDTFKELIKKVNFLKIYIYHPLIRDKYGHNLLYFELGCRKIITLSFINLIQQFRYTKSNAACNAEYMKFPVNMIELNKISDPRIIYDSIENMYDYDKIKNTFLHPILNSLEDTEKKTIIKNKIKNDISVKKDVFFIMIDCSITITKFNFKSKTFIDYYCYPLQYIEIIINETESYLEKIKDVKGNGYFDKNNNNLILNDLTDVIAKEKYKNIIQIIKTIIDSKVLLKAFSKQNTFDHFHINICKIMTLLDIYRDCYITWIGVYNLYKEFFLEWFISKNKVTVSLTPETYQISKSKLYYLEENMINKFKFLNKNITNDFMINSFGTLFNNINTLLYDNDSIYKLKIKNVYRKVICKSKFIDCINYINENKLKPEEKSKILNLRKKKLRKFKTSEYKNLILVEDYITKEYYICKNTDILTYEPSINTDNNYRLTLL